MDNIEFGRALEKITREFAVRIIRLSAQLPNTPEERVLRNQLTQAGTSIGANYREANRARSKADFRNKIFKQITYTLSTLDTLVHFKHFSTI